MKILFIAYEFPPHEGGMQNYAYELVKELSKNNEILVICKKEPRNFLIKNLTLYPVLSRDKSNYFANDMINCSKVIKNERPDIVHILNSGFSYFSVYLKKVLKTPVIITAHAKDFLQPWISPKVNKEKIKQLIVDGLNNADSTIAISNYTRKKLIEMGTKKKISVIFNGCNPDRFYPKEKNKKLLKKLKIKENGKVLLTVSRLTERKGYDVVIKSLPFVLEKFPEIKYLIIGRQVVGNEKKKLVRRLNLKKNVIFLGYVKDKELIDYYNLCDIFILTPKEVRVDNFLDVEGFGIVYLEAACCGKAVIASRSGGVTDAVVDEKTGILVKSEDVKETAEAIIKLLKNPKLSKRLGENGRKRVVEELNWGEVSKKILKLYKQAIKKCEKINRIKREIDEFKRLITKYPPSVSENEAKFLFNLPKIIPKKGVIVEIGTYKGGSAILLAKGSKKAKREKVYTIDHHKKGTLNIFKNNIKKAKVDDFVIPIINTSENAAKRWKKPISLLWIDGDHDYESVKKDFLLWEKYLVNGGIIAFHDSYFSRKKVLSTGLPLFSITFLGPKKLIKKYILNSKRFKNIREIDSITYAQKIKNAKVSERIKIHFSLLFLAVNIINRNIDRNLGKIGLFLREYHPKLYFVLKRTKNRFKSQNEKYLHNYSLFW